MAGFQPYDISQFVSNAASNSVSRPLMGDRRMVNMTRMERQELAPKYQCQRGKGSQGSVVDEQLLRFEL